MPYMPHMQRITWSGIALHGGVLPGRPASHGCIRLPFDFAERLFDATAMGMRVIVAPADVAPVELAHPLLFQPKPGAGAMAAARTAEAQEAARKAAEARLAVGDGLPGGHAGQGAGSLGGKSEASEPRRNWRLPRPDLALAISAEAKEQAEDAKAKAAVKIAELQLQWDAANADLQQRLDAVTSAREAAAAAETARAAAAEAARQVARELQPISVLISRKTQRLYVRQAFKPILESPVTIADPDRPIGTHVFTAIERSTDDANLRWSVVSLGGGRPPSGTVEPHDRARGNSGRDVEPVPTDPGSAKAALDRISHSAGRIGSHRQHYAAIFPDRHGRGVEPGNRQGNGIRGAVERRAARGHQETAAQSGDWIPLRAPTQPPFWRSPFGNSFFNW